MARPGKYTNKRLTEAVSAYFDGISRYVTLTEKKPTGRKDESGHEIFETAVIRNVRGEPVVVREYLIPPTVEGLCFHLGIVRQTWDNYCDGEKHPEFLDTTTRARGRLRAYCEQELLTRKDVKGIIFNLENNYGYREKHSITVTGGVEDYLRKLDEEGSDQSF